MKSIKIQIVSVFAILISISITAQSHIDYMQNTGSRNLDDIQSHVESKLRGDTSKAARKDLKFFNRWKHNVAGRLDRNGNLFNYATHNHKEMNRFLKTHPNSTTSPGIDRNLHGAWENRSLGKTDINGPNNGRINCIAFHPTNANIIYVGTPVGGIWVTYSGGVSWLNLNPGMDNLGISDIAINPSNPNEIFIITGDGNAHHTPSMGVFKSTNGGFDWEKTALFWEENELIFPYKLIMNPTTPDRMYVTTNKGLYKTSDGWSTFEKRLDGKNLRDLEFRPYSYSTILASSKNKVYKTYDHGDTWAELSGLPTPTGWDRVEMAVTYDDQDYLYVVFAKNNPSSGASGHHQILRSTNFGQTFTLTSSQDGMVSNQVSYNLDISVQPGDPNTIYLGAVKLYKSTNSGGNYTVVAGEPGKPNIHADVHDIEWVGNTLYTGTDGGISKSTDYGNTFTNLSDGLIITQFYDIDVKGDEIVGGAQDNGTLLWDPADDEMQKILGADGIDCFFHPTENGIYVSSQNNRFRKFNNEDWIKITPPGQEGIVSLAPFKMHPIIHDIIYSTGFTFARSYNKGDDWDILDVGFTLNNRILAMAQSIDDVERIYVASTKEIRRTSNAHVTTPTWIDILSNLPIGDSLLIGDLAVDPTNKDKVWVTLLGYGDGKKVFYSSSGGIGSNAWTNISENLPNVPTYCIEYLPGSNGGLYVGTDFGVFYKDNSLSEWIWFSNGLPKTRIDDIKITNDYLYVGTFGQGVWRSSHIGNCPYALVLNAANDPSPAYSTGTQVHTANQIIVSSRIITGGNGSNVLYNAGNTIELLPGFHAEYNNEFRAYIDGCPD